MLFTVLKVSIAVGVITFASWLSGKKPELAGFITAKLPFGNILRHSRNTAYQPRKTRAIWTQTFYFQATVSGRPQESDVGPRPACS